MLHLHGAKVGGYIVLEPDGASDGGFMRYAAYLRTTRPPRPPPLSPSPASSSSSPSRRRFFFPRCNGSVRLNEGVLTWSFKAPQVMGGRLDERGFARVSELPEDVGDVGDDEAARGGPQGLDVTLAVLEEFATAFMSLAVSVASLDGEGGMKPTRITLRSRTLYSAASLAFFFLWVWVSNQKHLRCASVLALAWRSCSSAHLLATVFDADASDACSRRKVERLGTVGGESPRRGSGERCSGFAEFIVDKGREELSVSGSRRRGDD